MGQYCFARCRLSASSVVVCNARGRSAAAWLGAWPVRLPTLQGGTVRLRPVKATPCFENDGTFAECCFLYCIFCHYATLQLTYKLTYLCEM